MNYFNFPKVKQNINKFYKIFVNLYNLIHKAVFLHKKYESNLINLIFTELYTMYCTTTP